MARIILAALLGLYCVVLVGCESPEGKGQLMTSQAKSAIGQVTMLSVASATEID